MRLDLLLSERERISRTRAQNLIKTGGVSVNGVRVDKPSVEVETTDKITVVDTLRYVSLGGLKLENALDVCHESVKGAVCLDVGAANGGFTDCLLKKGAAEVSAVDLTIAFPKELAEDPRVKLFDGVNAKNVGECFEADHFDFISVDLSFISLVGMFGVLCPLLKMGGKMMALFKPQFEVGRKYLPKSGVVRDKKAIEKAYEAFLVAADAVGLRKTSDCPIPPLFPDKNAERTVFFIKQS